MQVPRCELESRNVASVYPFGVSLEICVSVMRPVLTLRLPLDNIVLFLLSEPL